MSAAPAKPAMAEPEKKTTAPKPVAEKSEDDYEDDWNDDAWGETDFGEVDGVKGAKKDEPASKPAKNEKKDLYFGQDDDLDDFEQDFNDKDVDKFNKVLSTSKETGGLLASIGIKNKDIAAEDASAGEAEEAPHNKSDLFDTSKDRIAKKAGAKAKDSDEEDFDLGFNSGKKPTNKEPAAASETKIGKDGDLTEDDQKKEVEEHFKMIYDGDAELRKKLAHTNVAQFSVEDKLQILEAYMEGGGAAGVHIDYDDDDDEKELAQMTEEEIEILNANFAAIYARDPELQAMLKG